MTSFLTPAAPRAVHRGLGFFGFIVPLINTGVSAYLQKEAARRAEMDAKQALNLAYLAQQKADAQAAADAAATSSASSYGAGLLDPAAIASNPTSLAVVGAAALGILWLLTRR